MGLSTRHTGRISVLQSLADPEIEVTLAVMLAGAALAGVMVWLERRPRDLSPRLVPTTPVMFIALLVAIVAAAHLLNLYGIQTGR
jgi:hypothetical protein